MLEILWIHEAFPGVDSEFIYTKYTKYTKPVVEGERNKNHLKTQLRKCIRARALDMFNAIFEGFLNVDINDPNFEFGQYPSWVRIIYPPSSGFTY
jgi:hypothetical protein